MTGQNGVENTQVDAEMFVFESDVLKFGRNSGTPLSNTNISAPTSLFSKPF